VFVPDGVPLADALARTTVVGIGAHPDDLELGAVWGPVSCADSRGFTGVVCTDGAGSPAAGDDVVSRRRSEQRRAAIRGGYGLMVQLGHRSQAIRTPDGRSAVVDELVTVLAGARPEVVLAHDPLDRHPSHVAAALAAIEACRRLSPSERPARLLGVEGWRPLGWLAGPDRVRLDVSGHDRLLRDLVACHASEVVLKRYDLAAEGRRRANATFDDAHGPDVAEQVVVAIDLTPLLHDVDRPVGTFVAAVVERFAAEAVATVRSLQAPERGRRPPSV